MTDSDLLARSIYAHWRYNGHRLGDAINRAGVDYETLPRFVLDTLTPTFEEWEAAEQASQAG